jgi:hypothetical protein
MSNVLLDEVVGEPLQGKDPELHPSGAPEPTHGAYSGSCYAIEDPSFEEVAPHSGCTISYFISIIPGSEGSSLRINYI